MTAYAMKLLRGSLQSIRNAVTSYQFESDHRAELATIERIQRRYAPYIERGRPDRYLWRSVCQYRCQAYARSGLSAFAANVLALLGLPLLLLLLRPARDAGKLKAACVYLKVDFHPAYRVPDAIRDKVVESAALPRYLTLADLSFACGLFLRRRAFYPELLFKFLLWIASVRPHLDRFTCQSLIQYCEYSAYSSLRKLFLNARGIRIANVTHGEEFISCRSAFASFDEYHAWQLTPPAIHDAMRIEYDERFTFNPCSGLRSAPTMSGAKTLGFLWPAIDASKLDLVAAQLNELSARGWQVIVRAHPNPKYANRFGEYRDRLRAQVSDAHQEGIHDFIDRTSIVVGHLSAALLQAVFRGREVVYLEDSYLASVRAYHPYYRNVSSVEPAQLAHYLCEKYIEGGNQ